jgi:Immunity protein 50
MPTTSGRWSDFLLDQRGLRALYSDTPELAELYEVVLVRDGPCLRLRFELDRLPEPMPKKWAAEGFNRAQAELTLIEVRDLAITGWGTTNVVNVQFVGAPGDFRFEVRGLTTHIVGAASHISLDRLSAYLHEESPT